MENTKTSRKTYIYMQSNPLLKSNIYIHTTRRVEIWWNNFFPTFPGSIDR